MAEGFLTSQASFRMTAWLWENDGVGVWLCWRPAPQPHPGRKQRASALRVAQGKKAGPTQERRVDPKIGHFVGYRRWWVGLRVESCRGTWSAMRMP